MINPADKQYIQFFNLEEIRDHRDCLMHVLKDILGSSGKVDNETVEHLKDIIAGVNKKIRENDIAAALNETLEKSFKAFVELKREVVLD